MKTKTMKTLRLFFILFFIPLTFHAQKTLTGLWTGSLSNDSTTVTVRKDQSFEIALTQYKQNVYGYSRSTFIVNDTLYYILKRVKGKIEGDVCEIKDEEILSYNFRGKIDKGVKITTTFRMNNQDSSWYLAGDWSTNKTKRFYSISGKVDLKEEPDMEKSKILPHLEELNLTKDIPFYAEAKKAEEAKKTAAVAKKDPPVKNTTTTAKKDPPVKKEEPFVAKTTQPKPETVAVNKPVEKKEEPVIKKEEPILAVNKPQQTNTTVQKDIPVKKEEPPKTIEPIVQKPQPPKQEPIAINKPVEQKPKPGLKKEEPVAVVNKPAEPVIAKKDPEPAAVKIIPEVKKTEAPMLENKPVIIAATAVKERKTAPPQEVTFLNDSLQLALYDNGEVDGDTVSVLLNGEVIMAKQGLKTSAIRKTIYMQPGQDEVTLVLYAENLGKFAPNTGLLVVYDGEERYQVRFSADLQQNASVIFRRKKK